MHLSRAITRGQERQRCDEGEERCVERRLRWSRWSASLAKASEASVDWEERICSQAGRMSIVPCLIGTRGKWPETLLEGLATFGPTSTWETGWTEEMTKRGRRELDSARYSGSPFW